MIVDVTRELERYGEYADAIASPITSEELSWRRRGSAPVPSSPRRTFPNWVVAVGAAIAVFVLIGGFAWLIGGPGSEVVDEPMPVTTTTPPSVPDSVQPVAINALPESSAPDPIDVTFAVAVSDGFLWASTEGGIARWDLETRRAEVFTSTDGLPVAEGGLGQVAVAPDGTVWAFTHRQHLVRFDGTRWSEPAGYDQIDVVNPRCVAGEECLNPITAMAIEPDGLLSLAVGPETLLQFDGTDWTVLPVSADETHGDGASAWAADMAVASDGTLWIASWEELLRYDGTTWDRFTTADGLPSGAISSVAVAPNGDVWVGTTDGFEGESAGGVARFNGDAWTAFDASDGLYANSVSAVDVGPDGTVWAVHSATGAPATSTERATDGISRFDGATWSSTSVADVGGAFGWGGAVTDDTGMLWISSRWGVVGFDGVKPVVLRVDETARPEVDVPHTVIEGGTDILATTVAKPVASAATCPAGSSPDAPGPVGQIRPLEEVHESSLLTAMDLQSGRIVAVAVAVGGTETWTFDVCTNTWTLMQPSGPPPPTGSDSLVYDADSDVVVSIGRSVAAYDVDTDTWAQGGVAPTTNGRTIFGKAVYDPISGLIVVRDSESSNMWAYDVDTDAWTPIRQGPIAPPGMSQPIGSASDHTFWDQHYAYDASTDRIVLYLGDNHIGFGVWDGAGTEMTWTYDPRAGEWTIEDTMTPELLAWGSGMATYDETTKRTVITADGVVAGYDAELHDWEIIWESPAEQNAYGRGTGVHHRIGAAVVYDPINDRMIVMGGDARMLDENPFSVKMDDVWAFDTATATWSELLTSSSP